MLTGYLRRNVEFTFSRLRAKERPHGHNLPVEEQVLNTLEGKIEAAQREIEHPYIIVADTLVEDPENPMNALGQPSEIHAAVKMLLKLSGRRHRVWTGTAIICGDVVRSWVESSIVEVDDLSDEVLESLVLSGSWRGKAGGYDLAESMGQHAAVVDGAECCVLGLAHSALAAIAKD
jgi:septum formation protein